MRRRKDMSCKELVDVITLYLEGALSRRDKKRSENHLSGCGGCTAYLEQMRTTIELTGTLTEESIPSVARVELLAAFRDWNSKR